MNLGQTQNLRHSLSLLNFVIPVRNKNLITLSLDFSKAKKADKASRTLAKPSLSLMTVVRGASYSSIKTTKDESGNY